MSEAHRQRLGELLIKANLIDDIQLRVALQAQQESGERLGTTLVQLGFIEEAVLAAFLSKQADMPCINIGNIRVPHDITLLVPRALAVERMVMPIRRSGDTLYVAMSDPFDAETVLALEDAIPEPLSVTPMIAPEISLRKCITRHYEPEKLEAKERTDELRSIVEELEADTIQSLHRKVDALTAQVDTLVQLVQRLADRLDRDSGASP